MQYISRGQHVARSEAELTDKCLGRSSRIRTDQICLLHLPHLLAIAALYVALVLHAPTREQVKQKKHTHLAISDENHASPRRFLRQAPASSLGSKKLQDFVGFFVALNVSMSFIATIAQEMVSFREDTDAFDTARPAYYGQTSH